jgi:hypothetical protein
VTDQEPNANVGPPARTVVAGSDGAGEPSSGTGDAAGGGREPASGGGEPPNGPAEPPSGPAEASPRLVRRVVCGFRQGYLPGDWLQTWRRLDRLLARARLKVKATLAPLDDLPTDTDILVVPPELREASRSAVPPGTPILVTSAAAAPGAFGELMERLQQGVELRAERIEAWEADAPKILTYRGQTLVD